MLLKYQSSPVTHLYPGRAGFAGAPGDCLRGAMQPGMVGNGNEGIMMSREHPPTPLPPTATQKTHTR